MRLTKYLFPKFLLAAAALTGITVTGLDLYITNYLADREIQQVRERLVLNASLAQMDLNRLNPADKSPRGSHHGQRAHADFQGECGRTLRV